jgi:hypothetical protein
LSKVYVLGFSSSLIESVLQYFSQSSNAITGKFRHFSCTAFLTWSTYFNGTSIWEKSLGAMTEVALVSDFLHRPALIGTVSI